MTMTAAATRTLRSPGATITYDVRAGTSSDQPPLFLIGTPMGASGFATLAGYFPDRTVITYDPRGAERSTREDLSTPSNPDERADDIHRVIQEVGGPVDMFASSGGAVDALALVATHPDDVRLLVAHEPPLASVLPDAESARAVVGAVADSYQRGGFGAGMAHFIAITSHRGPFPDDFAQQPAPDPSMFGMPAEDNGDRTDPLLGQTMTGTINFEPDFEALKGASTTIVMAAGVESEGEMANRGAHGCAEQLGTDVVVFPSHHGGFVSPESGWGGQPEAFAAKLREVLEERAS